MLAENKVILFSKCLGSFEHEFNFGSRVREILVRHKVKDFKVVDITAHEHGKALTEQIEKEIIGDHLGPNYLKYV